MNRHQTNCPNVIHGREGQVLACHREDCSPQVTCRWSGEERAAQSTAALTTPDLQTRLKRDPIAFLESNPTLEPSPFHKWFLESQEVLRRGRAE